MLNMDKLVDKLVEIKVLVGVECLPFHCALAVVLGDWFMSFTVWHTDYCLFLFPPFYLCLLSLPPFYLCLYFIIFLFTCFFK